ncbi:MAG TPA: beta-N-acetylhexosaminidase [Terriglobales bacterium]|nr:beta-N-acetylhexosaminidase [Terriglobales bacterium]
MGRSSELRQAAGQLLIMGFELAEMTSALRAVLRAIQPGGVILFSRNITGAQSTYELLKSCQAAVEPRLFRCVDLEGGTVDRLRDVIARAPAVADVAATQNPRLFRKHGRVIGEEVRALGFNVDFAPVLDLGFEASRQVLTTRTASADPKQAVAFAREFLRGLSDAHVLGCGKHFPGLGEANLDSHFDLPEVRKPFARMWSEDLLPYRELRRELPFVMVAHAGYPEVTKQGLPASLSEHWMQVLRKKIGYNGIIMADDLEMGGVTLLPGKGTATPGEPGSIEYAAVTTIGAGADMFLVCRDEENCWRAYEAVLREVEHSGKFRSRVQEAAKRVQKLKKNSRALRKAFAAPSEKTIARLKRELQALTNEVAGAQPGARG